MLTSLCYVLIDSLYDVMMNSLDKSLRVNFFFIIDMVKKKQDYLKISLDNYQKRKKHCSFCKKGTVKEGLVKLSDGVQFRLTDRWYGKVQVKHDGKWGRVCNANWGNKEASTLCRQLGYIDGHADYTSNESEGHVRMNDVNCTGSESSILECSHHASWSGTWRKCHDAEVICEIKSMFTFSLTLNLHNFLNRIIHLTFLELSIVIFRDIKIIP